MSARVPTEAEEQQLVGFTKQAMTLVNGGIDPDAAIEKIARAENLGRGTIELLANAYNTGRQLHQFKTASSILGKLADFPMADAEKIAKAIYPETVQSPKEAHDAVAVSDEYGTAPSWVRDAKDFGKAALDLGAMVKAADGDPKPPEPPRSDSQHAMKKAYGNYERAKVAYETARRQAQASEDTLRQHVGRLTDYFKQAECYRLPYAQVEHAVNAYMPEDILLLKNAYERANLGGRPRCEKTAADVKIQREPFDLNAPPFTIIKAARETAVKINQYRTEAATLKTAFDQAAGATIRPFVLGAPLAQVPPSQPSSSGSEKQAMPPAVGAAIGGYLSRSLGDMPQTKNDMVEDAWLELEDPSHQNEIRKIRQHALLNSLMTDPDDPISSHDPDKVVSAYNEIAQMAPRLAEQPAALRPVLRRKLQGLSEPFEAKEMTDIEKGLASSKGQTPASSMLGEAPNSIMG